MQRKGLIISGTASGTGKTLITAALIKALRQRGHTIIPAKCGPDFLDPGFLEYAAGHIAINLDTWAMREGWMKALTCLGPPHASILVEGVMGFYDGMNGSVASTAELAQALGWPVVIIADAQGRSATMAAELHGLISVASKTTPTWAGVIFNGVASPRHQALIEDAMARFCPQLSILGSLPRQPSCTLPSRHLGLIQASEIPALDTIINTMAELCAQHCDLKQLEQHLQRASPINHALQPPNIPLPSGTTVALARDAAFSFLYEAPWRIFEHHGGRVLHFSPLNNEPPPSEADGVFLPGGYPELYGETLAKAQTFRNAIRRMAADGRWIYGECGGYMVLGEALRDHQNRTWPMLGLLPHTSAMTQRFQALGYRQIQLQSAHPLLGPTGTRWRGHAFHYATMHPRASVPPLFHCADGEGNPLDESGSLHKNIAGSFVHLIDQDNSSP